MHKRSEDLPRQHGQNCWHDHLLAARRRGGLVEHVAGLRARVLDTCVTPLCSAGGEYAGGEYGTLGHKLRSAFLAAVVPRPSGQEGGRVGGGLAGILTPNRLVCMWPRPPGLCLAHMRGSQERPVHPPTIVGLPPKPDNWRLKFRGIGLHDRRTAHLVLLLLHDGRRAEDGPRGHTCLVHSRHDLICGTRRTTRRRIWYVHVFIQRYTATSHPTISHCPESHPPYLRSHQVTGDRGIRCGPPSLCSANHVITPCAKGR